MTGKIINLILLGVLVGVLLGGMLGAVIPDAMLATAIVGKLYLNALAIVAIILVLVGFPLALARYGDLRRFDNKSAGAFIMTVTSAVVIIAAGVVLVRLVAAQAISPHGFTAAIMSDFFQVQANLSGDYLGQLLPEGLLRAVLNASYLGWVLFALILGLVLPGVGTRGRTLQMFLEDVTGAMIRISELLFVLAPLGLIVVTGVLVARAGGSFSDIFSSLLYPVILVIALVLYCAVVLPLAIKWWHKVPENRGQRDDRDRGRNDRPMMAGGRPGQRPMGQDRGGRGRDPRFDRNRDRDRDRGDRSDRPRGDRDDRNRGERSDRDDRGDRDRGRRDFRRDRNEGPRTETPREDSPFAVSKSTHVFDPEAPSQAVPLPEIAGEETPPIVSEEQRPSGDMQRRDRDDRNDRGPRDRRDRDRRGGGGGGRDRQGRGGRDRGRGPRRFDRNDSGDRQPAPESVSAEGESNDFDAPSDLSRIFDPVPEIDNTDDQPIRSSRPEPQNDNEYSGETPSTPENEPEIVYGRSRHGNRPERQESDNAQPAPPSPAPETSDNEPKAIDHYSTEGIEFGRASRRKNRR